MGGLFCYFVYLFIMSFSVPFFDIVPPEIPYHILSFLDSKDICTLCRVNTIWKHYCDDEKVWRNLLKRQFPLICDMDFLKSNATFQLTLYR